MLFSVYEEPGDAGVVAIGYCRSRLITRYLWLGGLDSRSLFMCGGSTDKKSLKIYKILMCVLPFNCSLSLYVLEYLLWQYHFNTFAYIPTVLLMFFYILHCFIQNNHTILQFKINIFYKHCISFIY